MVVDDSATVRRALAITLRFSEGLALVAEASNGVEAVQLCEQVQPDVMLMDLHMPYLDGVAATRILHDRYPQLPILVLTASQDGSFVQEAMRAGAVGYLFKLVTSEELLTAIRAVYQRQPTLAPQAADAALKLSIHLAV
jgi:DNA-binding NarL/FixJ family response regulator